MNVDPIQVVSSLFILFLGIGIHEYAHCKFADLAGDPTPRMYGRVTLNLFKHLDPVGSVMMVLSSLLGFGFGWGKPSPMDSRKMRNPRWDLFVAVIAGPISNVCQAAIYASLFRVFLTSGSTTLESFFFLGTWINIELALFNLVPISPLDGHWLVGLLLPEVPRVRWFQFQRRIGFMGVIFLVILLDSSRHNFLFTSVNNVTNLLTGIRA